MRETAPASFGQEQMWLLDRIEGAGAAYNVPLVVHVRGPLDAARLRMALRALVDRHEILRTSLGFADGRVEQHIHSGEAALDDTARFEAVVDCDDETPWRVDAHARASAPFELSRLPLIRFVLYRRAADLHTLLVLAHHAVIDGWSQRVLLEDLATLYGAAGTEQPARMAELPLQYADCAIWQRTQVEADPGHAAAYWRDALADLPASPDLPADRVASRPSWAGAHQRRELASSLVSRLDAFARERRTTRTAVTAAACGIWLSRLTGEADLVLGVPAAARVRPEQARLVGYFVNTLPLRATFAPDETFTGVTGQVAEALREALLRQDYPLQKIVAGLTHGGGDAPPLIRIVVTHEAGTVLADGDVEWQLDPLAVTTDTAKFDLSLFFVETSGSFAITAEYRVDRYEPDTVAAWLEQYEAMLTAALAAPDTPVGRLSSTSAAARTRVRAWGAARAAVPPDDTLPAVVRRQACSTPDASALVDDSGAWTYAEVLARAEHLAAVLRAAGVTAEARVATLLERTRDLPLGWLATLLAGGAYVPLEPTLPPERLAFVLDDAAPRVVLVHEAYRALIPPSWQARVLVFEAAAATAAPAVPGPGATHADQLACLLYTSGSTGRPKAVAVTHRNVLHLVHEPDLLRLGPGETLPLLSTVLFDLATLEAWGPLLTGARCVVVPDVHLPFDVLGDLLARHGVTTLWLTAALFNATVDAAPGLLRPVRRVLTGGEPVSVAHVCRARAALPDLQIVNGYGPTEATTLATLGPVPEDLDETWCRVPIGRPMLHVAAYVVDEDGGLAPPGQPGDLWLGGVGVTRGYWGQPALTADRFRPDPFGDRPGARVYVTGDRACWRPDGTLDFLGRRDAQVKLRGMRIELGEIEAALTALPEVAEAVVTLREDRADARQLVAYLRPAATERPTLAVLHQRLAPRLPSAMLPSSVVWLDTLPRTRAGKHDHRALPAPEPGQVEDGEPLVSGTEQRLAALWHELLGEPVTHRHAHFFSLGGHSLLAAQLAYRIGETFHVAVPVHRASHLAVLSEMAAYIDGAGQEGDSPPFFMVRRGTGPTLYMPYAADGGFGAPALFEAMPDDVATCLLTPPEGDVGGESIQELVVPLVTALLSRRSGPIHLAGYSFAGYLAYEIARQLRARGGEVGVLALIDSGPDVPMNARGLPGMAASFLRNLPRWVRHELLSHPPRVAAVLVGRKLAAVAQRLVPGSDRSGSQARSALTALYGAGTLPADYAALVRRRLEALFRYEPAPYDGPMVLVRASTYPLFHSHEPDFGWSAFVADLRVRVVRATHRNLVLAPQAAEVGRILAEEIRRAEDARIAGARHGKEHR